MCLYISKGNAIKNYYFKWEIMKPINCYIYTSLYLIDSNHIKCRKLYIREHLEKNMKNQGYIKCDNQVDFNLP